MHKDHKGIFASFFAMVSTGSASFYNDGSMAPVETPVLLWHHTPTCSSCHKVSVGQVGPGKGYKNLGYKYLQEIRLSRAKTGKVSC